MKIIIMLLLMLQLSHLGQLEVGALDIPALLMLLKTFWCSGSRRTFHLIQSDFFLFPRHRLSSPPLHGEGYRRTLLLEPS